MSIEWYIPDTTIPVRQGDILLCRDPHRDIINHICLVITADCDISQNKFGSQLACLRIIFLEEYLRTIWSVRKLNDAVDKATTKILEQIKKWHSLLIQSSSNLTSDAVTTWARRVDPEAICSELKIPAKEAKQVTAALSSFRAAIAVLDDKSSEDKLKQLVSFRAAIQGLDVKSSWQKTLQEAQGEKLREDAFLLPGLPQIDSGPAVVLLREIIGVQYEAICYRTIDALSSAMYLRIGRLEPIFKYSVSQAFGALYSRIGLPDDYQLRCKEVSCRIGEISWE